MKTNYLKLSKAKQLVIVTFFIIFKLVLFNFFGAKLFAYIEFLTFYFVYFVSCFFCFANLWMNRIFLLINNHQIVGLFLMNSGVSFLFYLLDMIIL